MVVNGPPRNLLLPVNEGLGAPLAIWWHLWVKSEHVLKFLLAKMSFGVFYSNTLNGVNFLMFLLGCSCLTSSPENKQTWPETSWKILPEISIP